MGPEPSTLREFTANSPQYDGPNAAASIVPTLRASIPGSGGLAGTRTSASSQTTPHPPPGFCPGEEAGSGNPWSSRHGGWRSPT